MVKLPAFALQRVAQGEILGEFPPQEADLTGVNLERVTMAKINEVDEAYQRMAADKKAGYPPNCNEGYVEKDGKCVPSEKEEAAFRYEHPKTGEVYTYRRKGIYKKDGVFLIYRGEAQEG